MKPNGSPPVASEADFLPLSALQHLLFCERQCALIYLEGAWDDNRLTAEGRVLHEHVHTAEDESRGDVRICRGLRLKSARLGLVGQADVVEFQRQPDGVWVPFPVEYKHGRPKPDICDEVQLCAQAICLEEMLGVNVPEGAIFYGQPRRRQPVVINATLRRQTEVAAQRLRELMQAGVTPSAVYEKRCDNCSLLSICLPKVAARQKSVARYLGAMLSS
jgi:CRISPR-associated exonuclease Cas4